MTNRCLIRREQGLDGKVTEVHAWSACGLYEGSGTCVMSANAYRKWWCDGLSNSRVVDKCGGSEWATHCQSPRDTVYVATRSAPSTPHKHFANSVIHPHKRQHDTIRGLS